MQTLQQLLSGELKGSTRLKLSCGLTEFPTQIFELADSLEVLDLSQNHLSQLPNDFGRLSKLRIVFFSDNDFTELPEVLSQCKQLDIIGFKANKISHISESTLPQNIRWLILTNNRLTAIPKAIGQCGKMQKLMLAGNQIAHLPDELQNCQSLGLLRISMNLIEKFPSWLLSMPNLSWLAFSRNPFHNVPISSEALPEIPWHHLELTKQLGEGASGIISKAVWTQNIDSPSFEEVAVKVFKGEVTSDGMPDDEMDACMRAGTHPNLVKVLGKISDHPFLKKGLVLELIPSSYTNLGGPPSFITCTRDTFAQGTSFSIYKILQLSLGIASAALHLHERGIMHGDLYAHNILSDENDHPLFGDFGAATLYDRSNVETAAALERLEVSAFGWLLDDLLHHVDKEEPSLTVLYKLKQLQQYCVEPLVKERPDFASIVYDLTLIKNSYPL